MLKFFKSWTFKIGTPVIASLILYYFFGIGKPDPNLPDLKVNNSPNSIITVGQEGNNTIVNENAQPKIIKQVANAINIPQDNLYNQTFELYILNPSDKLLDIQIKDMPQAKIVSSQVIPEGPAIMGNGQPSVAYFISFNTEAEINADKIEFVVAEKN